MKNRYLLLPIILLIMLLSTGCQSNQNIRSASKGYLDLSQVDFNRETVVLNGNWEFYWKQLLTPHDFNFNLIPTGYYNVDMPWSSYPDLKLPSKGYATYRLILKMDDKKHLLNLRLSSIYSEYRLWINGKLLENNISDATHPARYMHHSSYDFTYQGDQLEIIFQIKNDNHIFTGVSQQVELGDSTKMHLLQTFFFSVDFLLAAICLYAGLYNLYIYFQSKRTLNWYFYFGILCLIIFLRTLVTNETILMEAIPDLPYYLGLKLSTLTLPCSLIVLLLNVRIIYRNYIPRKLLLFFLMLHTAYAAIILLGNTYQFSSLLVPYLIMIFLMLMLGIYYAIKMLLGKCNLRNIFFLPSLLLLLSGVAFDTLVYLNLVSGRSILSFDLTLFILINTVFMGIYYRTNLRNIDKLSQTLGQSLQKLDTTQSAFYTAQLKQDFILDALTTISEACRYNPREAEKLIHYLSKFLRCTLSLDNLKNLVPLEKELELVTSFYNILLYKYRNLQIDFDMEDQLLMFQLPPLILHPLLEACIMIAAPEKNNIYLKLSIRQTKEAVTFTIDDNQSIGLEKLSPLLSSKNIQTDSSLYHVHIRLLRIYGHGLLLERSEDNHTVIRFNIPVST